MARRRYYDDDWHYSRFPRSVPKTVKGGIRSQSQRGAFGESWWAKRWIQVLESFQIGARLGRGRSYARSGQVLSIEIEKGAVLARVQGSRPKPYQVKIAVKTLKATEWRRLGGELSRQALYSARLLAGEMPTEIEEVFQSVKLSLFPKALRDLKTDCSCPDWSNPCKHIAAVYYLLGEEFDRDPFLIFRLRGVSREELLELLSTDRERPARGRRKKARSGPPERDEAASRPEPLSTDSVPFWQGTELPAESLTEVLVRPVSAVLLRRLGKFPFWRGAEPLLDCLAPTYQQAPEAGLRILAGPQRPAE